MPKPKTITLHLELTTEDPEVLKKHGLFKIDNTWIKGQLYFLGGRLMATENIFYSQKDLISMHLLTKAGIVAQREVKE